MDSAIPKVSYLSPLWEIKFLGSIKLSQGVLKQHLVKPKPFKKESEKQIPVQQTGCFLVHLSVLGGIHMPHFDAVFCSFTVLRRMTIEPPERGKHCISFLVVRLESWCNPVWLGKEVSAGEALHQTFPLPMNSVVGGLRQVSPHPTLSL